MLLKVKGFMLVLPMVIWIGSYFCPSDFSRNRNTETSAQIEKVILNYAEGIYEEDSCRIYDSVHPLVIIRGGCDAEEGKEADPAGIASLQDHLKQHGSTNKINFSFISGIVKKIDVFDIHKNTATARLTAIWGTEYIHLSKSKGKWYLVNILCQSVAPKEESWSLLL